MPKDALTFWHVFSCLLIFLSQIELRLVAPAVLALTLYYIVSCHYIFSCYCRIWLYCYLVASFLRPFPNVCILSIFIMRVLSSVIPLSFASCVQFHIHVVGYTYRSILVAVAAFFYRLSCPVLPLLLMICALTPFFILLRLLFTFFHCLFFSSLDLLFRVYLFVSYHILIDLLIFLWVFSSFALLFSNLVSPTCVLTITLLSTRASYHLPHCLSVCQFPRWWNEYGSIDFAISTLTKCLLVAFLPVAFDCVPSLDLSATSLVQNLS